MRSRVLEHLTGGRRSARELRMAQQVKRIEWRETTGELGAQLLEHVLVKSMQPGNHPRQKEINALCSWQMVDAPMGGKMLVLKQASGIDFGRESNLYGAFDSSRRATEALRNLAEAHKLCLVQLGLELPARGKLTPCFGYKTKKCRGRCIGRESSGQHDLRLLEALIKMKLQTWPYTGPIGIRETFVGREEIHIIDHWAYLGTAKDATEVATIVSSGPKPAFDLDLYKMLVKHLKQAGTQVVTIDGLPDY